MLSHFSESDSLATLWTVAHQAPLSIGFSRQEYWSGLPFPSPGDFPDPEIEPTSLVSPALAGRFFNTSATLEGLNQKFLSSAKATLSWTHCSGFLAFTVHLELVNTDTKAQWLPSQQVGCSHVSFLSTRSFSNCLCAVLSCSDCVWFFATPWTVALQAPLSMGFSRQEYWSGKQEYALQGIIPTQGSNPGLLHCRQTLYYLIHQGSPRLLEWVTYPFSRESSWPKELNLGSPALQADSLPAELQGNSNCLVEHYLYLNYIKSLRHVLSIKKGDSKKIKVREFSDRNWNQVNCAFRSCYFFRGIS